MDALLRAALADEWELDLRSARPVHSGHGRTCFRLEGAAGPLLVRVQDAAGAQYLRRGLQVQAHLHAEGFPAPRVRRPASGGLWACAGERTVSVEEWVAGEPLPVTAAAARRLGERAGELHARSLPESLAACSARLEPRGALGRWRARLGGRAPAEYAARLSEIAQLAGGVDELGDVPRALIHGDLAWGNAVQRRDGTVVLLDFEGAGAGPPIVDLAEVTTHLADGPAGAGRLREPLAVAFYEGYRGHRTLSEPELTRLADAHLLHQLCHLDDALDRGDWDFVQRMGARLDAWRGGALERLFEIARG